MDHDRLYIISKIGTIWVGDCETLETQGLAPNDANTAFPPLFAFYSPAYSKLMKKADFLIRSVMRMTKIE